jgi:hypothetical protein
MGKGLYSVEWYGKMSGVSECGRNRGGEFQGSVVISCCRNRKTTTATFPDNELIASFVNNS